MADFVKDVTDSLAPSQRYISVTESDVSDGDVIRVYDSLGRHADTITIEADASSDLKIRINSRVKRQARRQYPSEHPFGWARNGEKNLTEEVEYQTNVDQIEVGNTTSAVQFALNDIPITDVEVSYSAGTFTILLS